MAARRSFLTVMEVLEEIENGDSDGKFSTYLINMPLDIEDNTDLKICFFFVTLFDIDLVHKVDLARDHICPSQTLSIVLCSVTSEGCSIEFDLSRSGINIDIYIFHEVMGFMY